MDVEARLFEDLILAAAVLLWAKWSWLDLRLRPPAMEGVWPWILLFIAWCAVEEIIIAIRPLGLTPEWREAMLRLSLSELILLAVVLDPLIEELFFRGVLFSALLRRWGTGVAIAVPSVLWGLIHVQYEAWYTGSIAVSGLVLGVIRWKSGSLYVPLALHAAFNLFDVLAYA